MFVQSTNQWRNQRFKLEEKLSWKIPTDLCKRPTSQHSEKKLEKWRRIQVWMAIQY